MGGINICSWGLWFGGVGQAFVFGDLFPGFSRGVGLAISLVPWLIIFGISFCKGPPCGPRPFRRFLIFAMAWYALVSIVLEAAHLFIHVPPRGVDPVTAGRVMIGARIIIVLGAISFIGLIRACNILRGFEAKQALDKAGNGR